MSRDPWHPFFYDIFGTIFEKQEANKLGFFSLCCCFTLAKCIVLKRNLSFHMGGPHKWEHDAPTVLGTRDTTPYVCNLCRTNSFLKTYLYLNPQLLRLGFLNKISNQIRVPRIANT